MDIIRIKKITGALLLGISLILLGVAVYLCFCSDIWYDELFTMGLANSSFGELVSRTARDVHPPLYYVIVKLALGMNGIFGGGLEAVAVAKLVSVFPFFLLFLYAVTRIRRNFGILTAGFFMILVTGMPQLSTYITEVRMYGYALFFITAMSLHAYELVKSWFEQKTNGTAFSWIAITLYALAAAYTHYFACVAAAMVYLCIGMAMLICLKKKNKVFWQAYIISSAVCVIGYLPWISVVLKQVSKVEENYWILPLTIRSLGGCVKFLFKPAFTNGTLNVILAVLLAGCFGAYLLVSVKKCLGKEKNVDIEEGVQSGYAIAGVVILAGVVGFGFAASFILRPIFVYRYMLPAMGVLWLAFAVMVGNQKKKQWLCLFMILLFAVVSLRDFRAYYGEEMWKKVQMKETLSGLAVIEQDDLVICNFDQTQGILAYYLPNESYLYAGEPEELIHEMYPQTFGMLSYEEIEQKADKIKEWIQEGKTVWFAGSGNVREEIKQELELEQLKFKQQGSCLIERYWFDLYQITQG